MESYIEIQLILSTAFDGAGLRMLDSIREIIGMLGIEFDSLRCDLVEFNNYKELTDALNRGKCPIVDVLKTYYSFDKEGSHVMVATGVKKENGVRYIQLKNSFADNPNEQGKVHFYESIMIVYISQ